jgi:ATP-dependent Lon protease, bacterial type
MKENEDKDPSEPKITLHQKSDTEEEGRLDKPKVPQEMPLLPIKDTVVFPNMVAALSVVTERDIKLLNHVLAENRFLALVAQKDKDLKVVQQSDLYDYATAAVVLQMLRMPDNSAKMLVQGICRIKIDDYIQTEPYFKVKVTVLEDIIENDMETEALARNAADQFVRMISLAPSLPEELKIAIVNVDSPSRLADMIASHLNIGVPEKQRCSKPST